MLLSVSEVLSGCLPEVFNLVRAPLSSRLGLARGTQPSARVSGQRKESRMRSVTLMIVFVPSKPFDANPRHPFPCPGGAPWDQDTRRIRPTSAYLTLAVPFA